ncbi:MAG: M28 family peptidase [Acidobacteria bacterium]|nr:M28 family peptidase [Acidobacteriota bacterium]
MKMGRLGLIACVVAILSVAAGGLSASPTGPAVESAVAGLSLVRVESPDAAGLEDTGGALLGRFSDGALLAALPDGAPALLQGAGVPATVLDGRIEGSEYWFIHYRDRALLDRLPPDVAVLHAGAGEALVRAAAARAESLPESGFEIRRVTLYPKPLAPRRLSAISPDIAYNSQVQGILDAVSTEWLMLYVKNLSGVNAVTIGGSPFTLVTRNSYKTEQIQKATQYAYEFFQSLGLQASYHTFQGAGQRNVVARKPGATWPDQHVIICGHLDDMPPGPTAPGADDNASGSVGVMAAARILKDHAFDYSLVFALWTGEEQGLVGSGFYANQAFNDGMKIRGVVNLDMISYDGSGGPDLDLHAISHLPDSMNLCLLFQDVVSTYGLYLTPLVLNDGVQYSDHASFWDYGFAAMLGIESDNDFTPYYHKTTDTWTTLNPDYFTNYVKASLGTVAHLAGIRPSGDVNGDHVCDAQDAVLLAVILADGGAATLYGPTAGDLNSNGAQDAGDLVTLLLLLAGAL